MMFFVGFAIGLFYGCFLWWQTLIQGHELHQEYLKLQRELMLARRQLWSTDRTAAYDWPESYDGPTTTPSRN